MVLHRVGTLSLAKIAGSVYAVFGLIVGALFALLSLVTSLGQMGSESGIPLVGGLFGVGAVILLPIFYGVLGFLGGLLAAALYNVFAGIVGGVELDLR